MEKTENGTERLRWLDWAKGFAMLLVLIGHSMRDEMRQVSPVLDFFYRAFYIFHMSYFFWLSGYGYRLSRSKGRQPMQILSRRIKKQLPPWVVYTLFIFLVFTLAIRIPAFRGTLEDAGYGGMTFFAYILNTLQANNPWAYHLWFLYVLILLMTILCCVDGMTKGHYTTTVCVGLSVIGLAGLAVRPLLPLGEWWRLVNYLSLYLPMVCLGVLMAEWKLPNRVLWLWGGAGLAYIVVRVLAFSGFSGNSLRLEDPAGRFIVYLLADMLLPGLMMLLNRLFEQGRIARTKAGKKVLLFLGRESMTIYLVHQPFCCAFLGLILYHKLHIPAVPVMIACLIASVLVPLIVTWAVGKMKMIHQRKAGRNNS